MRSPELKEWVNSLSKTPDGFKAAIMTMPKRLKGELLREAFIRNPKIKQVFDEGEGLPLGIREINALVSYCKTADVFKDFLELKLGGWNDGNVPSSNIIDTSSLFSVLVPSREGERAFYRKEVLFSRQNTTIIYTGEQLFQFDWDVFHAMLCLSKGRFDKLNVVSPMAVLSLLGLGKSGRVYDLLEASLDRLSKAFISIIRTYPDGKYPDVKIGIASHSGRMDKDNLTLIGNYSWRRGYSIAYSLDARLSMLFGNFEYGLIDWETRNRMGKNEMAKKLQCLLSGQKANQQFHKAAKVRELCKIRTDMAGFTRLLEKALNVLLEVGVIQAYWIEKPKKSEGQEKVFCVWKDKCPPSSGQNPDGRRGKYCDRQTLEQRRR